MTASAVNEQALEQLLTRARTERVDAALEALSAHEWVVFSAFPAWPVATLEAIIPSATSRLQRAIALGQVCVDSRPLELRRSDGEREDFDGPIWWIDPAARAKTLRAGTDADLTGIVRDAAQRLLASALPLPFPSWRAATIASESDMADALRSRVDKLLPGWSSAAADIGQPDEALAWIEASRYLAAALGSLEQTALQLAAELAGRSVDLYHRRLHDLQQDRSFVPVESVLAEVETFLDQEEAPWGLHVLGQGGVGKTMLLRHVLLERAAREGWAVARVDFDFLDPAFPRREPWMLLVAIVAELRLQARTASDTSRFVELDDGVAHLGEASLATADDPFEHALFHKVLELLGSALRGRPTLLLLDTCEELERLGGLAPGSDAVTAMFRMLEMIKTRVPQLRVLLAGRRALAVQGHGWAATSTPLPARDWLAALELFGFCSEQVDALLDRHGQAANRPDWAEVAQAIRQRAELPPPSPVLEMAHREQIYYLPYELAVLAEWAASDHELTAAELADPNHDVYVERRIIPRLRRCLRRALPGLVACGTFDAEVVACLVGSEEAGLAWREASRQEWVFGDQWVSIHPSFRDRLDRYFRQEQLVALRAELATKARAHLQSRLDATTLETDPAAVEAWARAGTSPADLGHWQRWEAVAIAAGAWDWIARATEQLLGAQGPAQRGVAHPLGEVFLLSRLRAAAMLRPGLTGEWLGLWSELETRTSDPVLSLRARGQILSVKLAATESVATPGARAPSLEEPQRRELERELLSYLRAVDEGRHLPTIPVLVTLLDTALEVGRSHGPAAWSPELCQLALHLLRWVLATDTAPLCEEAAALAIRWSPRTERLFAVDRYFGLVCATTPAGQPWEWPWRDGRRGERLVEVAASLWPSCEGPAVTLDRLRNADEQNAHLLSFGIRAEAADPTRGALVGDPQGVLMRRFAEAVQATEPKAELQLRAARAVRSTPAELPPYWLAAAHEAVQLGDFENPMAFVSRELLAALRRQSPRDQYEAERILVDMLTWTRHPHVEEWKFPYLASSSCVDDRLDAACLARLCSGESREPSDRSLDNVTFLDLAWQAGAWRHAGHALERLEKLVSPLPDSMRMFVALVRGIGETDMSELPLSLELDLVEATLAFDEAAGRPFNPVPHVAGEVMSRVAELSGTDPGPAFRLAARASVLCNVPRSLLDEPAARLGRRRAARLLRMEGERLALRVAGSGARLLGLAAEWFGKCDDRLGELTCRILARLASQRATGTTPQEDARALSQLWEQVSNALPLGRQPGALTAAHAAGDRSPWGSWARRAMVALGGEGDDRLPELRRRGAPLDENALGTLARETEHKLGSAGPGWFREWLHTEALRLRGYSSLQILHEHPPHASVERNTVNLSRLKLQIVWQKEGDETGAHVSIAAHSGESASLLDPLSFAEVREWRAQLPAPPKVLLVDESSAMPLWEDSLEAPEAVRSVDALGHAPQATTGDTLVVTSAPMGERLGYRFWRGGSPAFASWEEYITRPRPCGTLHLFTRPTLGHRGVLLGTDISLRSGGVRSTGAVVDVMHLLRASRPNLVVLQLPVEHWEADPEPLCGYLRKAGAELCQAGVQATIVLPALPSDLLFRVSDKGLLTLGADTQIAHEVNALRRAVRESLAGDSDPEHRKAALRITLYLAGPLLATNISEE